MVHENNTFKCTQMHTILHEMSSALQSDIQKLLYYASCYDNVNMSLSASTYQTKKLNDTADDICCVTRQ